MSGKTWGREPYEGWEQAGLKEAEEDAACNNLIHVVREARADGDGAPADDCDGEDTARAPFLDGQNPGGFEDDIGDVEVPIVMVRIFCNDRTNRTRILTWRRR